MRFLAPALTLVVLVMLGCDRNVEPFDPTEKVTPPDLSKIFPEGAKISAEQAGELTDEAPSQGPGGPARGSLAGAEPSRIRGTVSLAPELVDRVPRGGVLFIVVRTAPVGPPLAVKRIPDPSFPLDFELGPDDRMIASMPFVGPFQLSARIDGDGNASTRSPGDLQGSLDAPIEPGTRDVRLVIDEAL